MAHSSASSLSTCHQAPVQTGVAHQGTPDDFKPSSVAMEIKPLMEIDLTAQETAVSSPQPNTSHYSTPVMLHTPQASNTPTPPHPHSTPVATHVHTSSSAKKAVHRKATSQQQWEPEINRAPPSSEKDRAPPSSEKMPRRQLRKVIKRCLDKYPNSPNTVLRRQLQEKVSLNHIVDMFRRGENSDLLGPLLQRGVISLTIPGHEAPPPSEPSTPQSSEEREGSVNPAGVSGGGGDYTPTQPPTHTTQRPPILPTPQSPSPTAPQPPTHTTTGHTPCIQGTSFEGSAESVIRKHLYTVSDQNTPGDADSANPVDRTDVLQNVTPVDAESAVVTGTLHGDDDGLPLFSDIDLSKYQASRGVCVCVYVRVCVHACPYVPFLPPGTGITSNSMLPTLHTSTPAQHHVSTHSVASSTPPQGHAHTPHGVAPDNTESDEEFLYNTRLQESSQPPITLHSPGTQPPTTLHSPGTQPPTTLHSPGTQPPTTLHSPGSTSFCTDEQLNTDGPSSLPDDMPHPLDDRPHPLVEQMGDCCEESDQELLALYRNSFAILKTVTGWAQPGAESAETSQDSEENPVSEGDFEESDESAESSPASEGNARDSEENAESANTGLDTKENAESAETRSDIEDNAESADTGLDIEENAESAETGLDIEENAESAETGLDIKENAESAEIGLDVEENAESASGYDEYVHSSDELSVGGANSPYPPLAVSGPTSKRSEEELISQRLRSRVQPAAERRDLHHSADSSGMASTDEEPMAMGSGQSEDTDPGPSEQSEEPVSQRLRSRRPQLTQPAYSSGTVSSDDLSVVKGGRLREQSGSDEEPVAQRRGRRTPVRIVVDTSSDEQSNRSNRSDKVRRVSQRLRRSPPSPDSSPGGRHSDRKPVRKRHKTHHRPSNQNDEPIALRLRRRRASPRVNEISDATVTLSDESTSDGQLTVSDDNKESSNENEAPISQRLRKRWPRQQHLHTQLQSSTRPVTRLVTRLVTKAFVDSDSSDDEHLAGREIPQTAGECKFVEHSSLHTPSHTPHPPTLHVLPHSTHPPTLHVLPHSTHPHTLHILPHSTHPHTLHVIPHSTHPHTPSHTPHHPTLHTPSHTPRPPTLHTPSHTPRPPTLHTPSHTPRPPTLHTPSHTPHPPTLHTPSHTPRPPTLHTPSHTPRPPTLHTPSHTPRHPTLHTPSHTPRPPTLHTPSHTPRPPTLHTQPTLQE